MGSGSPAWLWLQASPSARTAACPCRTAAAYRSYDGTAVDRLQFIQAQAPPGSLRLREVRAPLAIRGIGRPPSGGCFA